MADIINLRRARKQRQRAEKDTAAQGNRLRFGLSGADRRTAEDARERERRRLEGHRLEHTDRDPSADDAD
jgi:hypothetical protein